MKQVHPNYTFVASTKTITLTGLNIAQDQLLLITNATRGVIYYNFASSSHRAEVTAGANTTVVLADASTTGHANEDQLVIHYDDQLSTQAIAGTVTANVPMVPNQPAGQTQAIPVVLITDEGKSVFDVNQSLPVYVPGTVTIGSLPAISGTVTANAGTGTFAVSAASLPLPSGAATSANQATANTSLSSIDTDLGAPADSAASTDTGTFSLISLFKRLLQRITALIPSNLTVTSARLLVDGSGVTQPISGTVTANLAPQASGPIIQIDSAIPSDPKYATIVGGFDPDAGESRALRLGSNGEMIVQDPALIAKSGGSVSDSVQNIQVIGGRTGGGSGSSSYAPASIDGNGGLQVGVKWIDTNSGNQPRDPSQQTPFPVQVISATSLPLPSDAATSANQTTANTSLASIDANIGATSESAATTDTGTFSLISLFKRLLSTKLPNAAGGRIPVDGSGVTQPVSGTVEVSSLPNVILAGGNVIAVSNLPATQPVSGTVTANLGNEYTTISSGSLSGAVNSSFIDISTIPNGSLIAISTTQSAGAYKLQYGFAGFQSDITLTNTFTQQQTTNFETGNATYVFRVNTSSPLTNLRVTYVSGGVVASCSYSIRLYRDPSWGLATTVVQGTATNLRTQAESYQGGSAVGSGNPLQVTLANTGANATAVKVDGSAVTQPVTDRGSTGEATVSNFTSTTSATLKASNSDRKLLTIFNEGAGNLHVLYGSGTASTTNYSVRLSSGDYLEVDKYTGQINAIFATAGTARVTEIT